MTHSENGGLTLRPVTHSNKVVAVGAALFYVDHYVTGRISKFTYGASCYLFYNPSNREHVRRKKKTFLNAAGDRCVPDCFTSMLLRVCHPPLLLVLVPLHDSITLQGTKVLEYQELRTSYVQVTEGAPLRPTCICVVKYTGTDSAPEWNDIEPGNMFSSDNVVRDTQVQQTSLRRCVVWRQISLLRRIRRSVDPPARCARHGFMI